MEKIVQIIPADGWSAVFAFRNDDTGAVALHEERLSCWALLEEHREQYMGGCTPGDFYTSPVDKDPNFVGYRHVDDEESAEEKYLEEAGRHLQWQEERAAKRALLMARGYRLGTNRGLGRWRSPYSDCWLDTAEALKELEGRDAP
jgi:hypothetical protein